MQLLRRTGVVVNVDCDLPPLLEAEQRSRKLTVIRRDGDDALGRNLHGAGANVDGVIGRTFSLRCGAGLSRAVRVGDCWKQGAARQYTSHLQEITPGKTHDFGTPFVFDATQIKLRGLR